MLSFVGVLAFLHPEGVVFSSPGQRPSPVRPVTFFVFLLTIVSAPPALLPKKVPELFVPAVGWRAAMAMSLIEARILEEADPQAPAPAASGGQWPR
jgi:hypothetical protein